MPEIIIFFENNEKKIALSQKNNNCIFHENILKPHKIETFIKESREIATLFFLSRKSMR